MYHHCIVLYRLKWNAMSSSEKAKLKATALHLIGEVCEFEQHYWFLRTISFNLAVWYTHSMMWRICLILLYALNWLGLMKKKHYATSRRLKNNKIKWLRQETLVQWEQQKSEYLIMISKVLNWLICTWTLFLNLFQVGLILQSRLECSSNPIIIHILFSSW